MATFSYVYSANDTTGTTIAIASDTNRSEIMIYNYGPNEAYLNFNESANDSCFYVPLNVGITFTGPKAKMNMYLACVSGESAEVGVIATPA